jgi:HSP90 family molecular chaperone
MFSGFIMCAWRRSIPFQVDIAGVIQIMGTSLYSRSDTPIRELLQNAHDAIQRRRQLDLNYQGQIRIRTCAQERVVEVADDGIGLTAEEAERYLGTLGIGLTGLLKGVHPSAATAHSEGANLIGQFGIGLFSSFLLADRIVLESFKVGGSEGVRWTAGEGAGIELESCDRTVPGTTIRLLLKPEYALLAQEPVHVEKAVKDYADYLPIPIFLNDGSARINVIQAAWFEATPEPEAIEMALLERFDETPLDIIPIRIEKPISIAGAMYVTPMRTPGFSGEPVVTTTIKRMVISKDTYGLLPPWASFLRGVLELNDCSPTASREDLVRNSRFEAVRAKLEELLFEHFQSLAKRDPQRMEAILSWHRYSLAGSALFDRRLRDLLRSSYRFNTSTGQLTFDAIASQCPADPIHDPDWDRVIWYNADTRQERWMNTLFADHDIPCVHAVRSFEESLLASMAGDWAEVRGERVEVRMASPSQNGFGTQILGVSDIEEAPEAWQQYFVSADAKIRVASFRNQQPVMSFLDHRHELQKSYEDLKRQGTVPVGFQRLIDSHFRDSQSQPNEVLLNRNHPLIQRVLSQRTDTPLASVLRLLVFSSLNSAGVAKSRDMISEEREDLEWIAEALWGRRD